MELAAENAVSEMLSFTLGSEEYGIGIHKVQEIRGYEAVTAIPESPSYLKGVINLRGVIVPIVDMRVRFCTGTPTYDATTVVIIVNCNERVTGIVVDSVSDVVALTTEQIRPAPEVVAAFDAKTLIGLGTLEKRMLILLDIDRLLADIDVGSSGALLR